MPGHYAKSDGHSVTWACRGALLAVISTEIALILLFLLVRIVLDTFSLWQTSMLSIAIGTYAIASKNQGLPKLASTTISKEYFNTWKTRNKAKIFWKLYRVILWFLQMHSSDGHQNIKYTENPFGDTICGMEHALIHISDQLFSLFCRSIFYSIARFLLKRCEEFLRNALENRLRTSLLSILLTRHFAQPYKILRTQNPGECAAIVREDAISVAELVTKIIDKAASPLNNILIMLYIGYMNRRRWFGKYANSSGDTCEEANGASLIGVYDLISDKRVVASILIALIPLPIKLICTLLEQHGAYIGQVDTRRSQAKLISHMEVMMGNAYFIKLYDSADYEIKSFLEHERRKADVMEPCVSPGNVLKLIRFTVKRYYHAVLYLSSSLYITMGILTVPQATVIERFVRTIYSQVGRLVELSDVLATARFKLKMIEEKLSLPQEAGSRFYADGGFMSVRKYTNDCWKCTVCKSDCKLFCSGDWTKVLRRLLTILGFPTLTKWVTNALLAANIFVHQFGHKQILFDECFYMQELRDESQRTDTAQEPSLLTGRIYPCTPVSIEFRDVCFSYEAGCSILHSLTLSVRPGQKVAIVGRSGVGKSTIINLLTRLYLADQPTDSPSSGIYLNEKAIESIPLGELRRLITVVPQDNILVRGSATDNIVYGQPRKLLGHHTEEEQRQHIQEVIRLSYEASRIAAAEELLGDTPYSGTLQGLSGGQRQRIGIARAIARGGSVLVLDESTSALDEKTEKRVIKQLFRSLDHNQSVIVITHRLSTLRQVDLIYVLSDPDGSGAHVVESGSYEWFVNESQYLKDMSQDASDDAIIYDCSSVSSTPLLSTTSVGTIDFSLDFRYAQ
ncbi:hypothetical protein QR46_4400 [Giardia duodenalis assemblage B]|uniref:ABC transporter domain-containing protein n=1 Tax=Giardia duodenalis assemblage B TaxID=1394984 RepID=A0A132NNQ6_GIAIN|nr:hypothetical protein QR46_4400 [Giardia intestinalis assemblage B]